MGRPKKVYGANDDDRAKAALLVLEHHQALLTAAVSALRAVQMHRPKADLALRAGQKYAADSEAHDLLILARTLGISPKKGRPTPKRTLRRQRPEGER